MVAWSVTKPHKATQGAASNLDNRATEYAAGQAQLLLVRWRVLRALRMVDTVTNARQRALDFCERFGLRVPILQAPMAGASPPALAIAVAEAGGMGAAGVLRESPSNIAQWVQRFRSATSGAFQLNIWTPDAPLDDADEHQRRIKQAHEFLSRFGTPGKATASPPDYVSQCEAMLAARPTVISSIMGIFDAEYVSRMHERGIAWFACATTLDEAVDAQNAGADAIVAQGMEAGGHRGTFDQEDAERTSIGLFALLPWLAEHLQVPIIAAGGIADGRGIVAALTLGASAVQVGTALLRCPETSISKEWAAKLDGLAPNATIATRAYTGRLARAARTPYLTAWTEPQAPRPAPYPDQLRLVGKWRHGAPGHSEVDRENFWAGQSAALATELPAGQVVARMWHDACDMLA
jgi:nitronate monooxygenase